MAAPALRHVLETCLYVGDMARARDFYERVMGLDPAVSDGRITGYRVGDTMLLLFPRGGATGDVELPGGTIPGHDGSGPAHFALSVEAGSLDRWRDHLEASGVELVSTMRWPKTDAVSLYFRDPDGHVVELATPGLWGID